jgi:hypothetical protein
MKRNLISAVIGAAGLAGLAVSSHGQGRVIFDNYIAYPYYPVVYGADTGSLQGTGAGTNVSVELGYALGANQTTGFTLIPSSITAIYPNLYCPAYPGNGPALSGWFMGPVVTIPDYVSGPITFEILAWTTTGGTSFDSSFINNKYWPTIWTEPSIQTVPGPASTFTALPGDIIIIGMPEPSSLALAGLGALLALAAFRSKKF